MGRPLDAGVSASAAAAQPASSTHGAATSGFVASSSGNLLMNTERPTRAGRPQVGISSFVAGLRPVASCSRSI